MRYLIRTNLRLQITITVHIRYCKADHGFIRRRFNPLIVLLYLSPRWYTQQVALSIVRTKSGCTKSVERGKLA